MWLRVSKVERLLVTLKRSRGLATVWLATVWLATVWRGSVR